MEHHWVDHLIVLEEAVVTHVRLLGILVDHWLHASQDLDGQDVLKLPSSDPQSRFDLGTCLRRHNDKLSGIFPNLLISVTYR